LERGSCVYRCTKGWGNEQGFFRINQAAGLSEPQGASRSAPILLLGKPCQGKYFTLSHSYYERAWVCYVLLSFCPQGTLGLFELM